MGVENRHGISIFRKPKLMIRNGVFYVVITYIRLNECVQDCAKAILCVDVVLARVSDPGDGAQRE